MLSQLKVFSPDWEKHDEKIIAIDTAMFKEWMVGLHEELVVA